MTDWLAISPYLLVALALVPLGVLIVGLLALLHWESADDNYRSARLRENIKKVAR